MTPAPPEAISPDQIILSARGDHHTREVFLYFREGMPQDHRDFWRAALSEMGWTLDPSREGDITGYVPAIHAARPKPDVIREGGGYLSELFDYNDHSVIDIYLLAHL